MQWAIQITVVFESLMTSVQRILEYADLPCENYQRTDVVPATVRAARGARCWCLVFGVWCLVFGVWCLRANCESPPPPHCSMLNACSMC